jgi:hypothetical protein
MRSLTCIAVALWLACSAQGIGAGEVEADEGHDDNTRGSTNQDSNQWTGLTHTVSYSRVDGYGPIPEDDSVSQIRVKWRSVKVNSRFGQLAIQAQLHLIGADGRPRAIDWFQGARVLVARSPGQQPDWSKGYSQKDAIVVDVIARNDGSFNAAIELTEIPRPIGSKGKFQVALVLARRTGKTVVWDAARPVLTGSVSTLEIPGPPKLDPTLELVNAVSGWPQHGGNGVSLVRAVNGLHKLGKQKALSALREYVELAGENWNRDTPVDPANIETGDHNCVFWIIRLLFEPARAGTLIPEPLLGAAQPSPDDEDRKLWPLFPIELVDDVPFMIAGGWNLGGRPEHPASHIVWAERYGVLRAEPLRPADNPLAVADRLLSLPKSRRLWIYDQSGREVKLQAWRMVADLFPQTTPAGEFGELTPGQWKQVRQYAVDRKLRWNDAKQSFVADSPK